MRRRDRCRFQGDRFANFCCFSNFNSSKRKFDSLEHDQSLWAYGYRHFGQPEPFAGFNARGENRAVHGKCPGHRNG